jgi:hypothetical protein
MTIKRSNIFTIIIVSIIVIFCVSWFVSPSLSLFMEGKTTLLLSTGTLIRNIAIAVFGISVWYSQDRVSKTREYLDTLNLDQKAYNVLHLLVELRDIKGFDEIGNNIEKEYLETLKRGVLRIRQTEKVRNYAIFTFVVGLTIEIIMTTVIWML